MDLRPRTTGAAPNWSWPRHETEDSGGESSADSTEAVFSSSRQTTKDEAAGSSSSHYYRHNVWSHSGSDSRATGSTSADAPPLGDDGDTGEPRVQSPPTAAPHQNHDGFEEELRRYKKRFRPRTCRICLEVVPPTFDDDEEGPHDDAEDAAAAAAAATENPVGAVIGGIGDRVAGAVESAMPSFFRLYPRVRYVSENPEDGPLMSPCHCKGSQKYVHEGCLTAWRLAQPLADRNYWKCPTCKFEYRFERLRWGRLISNTATQILLTLAVFWLAIFLLGFIADSIIDLWLDPTGTIAGAITDIGQSHDELDMLQESLADILHGDGHGGGIAEDGSSWLEHFFKGFLSLGIVGVVKTFVAVSPFTWLNLRTRTGRIRRRNGGQARIDSIGLMFVAIGIFTFIGAVWKGIRYLSRKFLDGARRRVVNVQDDNDDDNEDNDGDEGGAEGEDE